jgi:hypothetical protein
MPCEWKVSYEHIKQKDMPFVAAWSRDKETGGIRLSQLLLEDYEVIVRKPRSQMTATEQMILDSKGYKHT